MLFRSVALPPDADRPHAIEQLDLRIEAGRTLCVVGESGSGKSVLATTVMGLLAKGLSVSQGRVVLAGETLVDGAQRVPESRWRALRGQVMGMVFQEPMTALNPVLTCGEQLDELLRTHTSWGAAQRKGRVMALQIGRAHV